MDFSPNFRMLALYNQRMNKQLLDVCSQLTQEQLHYDMNAFFPSIMAHWNHILFGDLIMLQRLVDNQIVVVDPAVFGTLPNAKSVSDTFADSFEELRVLRELVDSIYVNITGAFNTASGTRVVRYTTTEGQMIERTVDEFCMHIFNHQTYHRGQLTCLLSQLGLDFGCTDLPVIVPEGAQVK
ncbi:DinB family protein [Vibrio hepatarius]|uniref:DinB family protein n=1 Tax=Vibrio hepatarius TaxID=171383 RepID=UPI002FD9D757